MLGNERKDEWNKSSRTGMLEETHKKNTHSKMKSFAADEVQYRKDFTFNFDGFVRMKLKARKRMHMVRAHYFTSK